MVQEGKAVFSPTNATQEDRAKGIQHHAYQTFDASFEGVKECHFQDSPGEQYIMELYKLADNCYYRLHDAR